MHMSRACVRWAEVVGVASGLACYGILGGKKVKPEDDAARLPTRPVIPTLPDSLRSSTSGAVVGAVVDDLTRQPVRSAELDLMPRNGTGDEVAIAVTRTGPDGGFTLAPVAPGAYEVDVRQVIGYAFNHPLPVVVRAGEIDTLIVRLPRAAPNP